MLVTPLIERIALSAFCLSSADSTEPDSVTLPLSTIAITSRFDSAAFEANTRSISALISASLGVGAYPRVSGDSSNTGFCRSFREGVPVGIGVGEDAIEMGAGGTVSFGAIVELIGSEGRLVIR